MSGQGPLRSEFEICLSSGFGLSRQILVDSIPFMLKSRVQRWRVYVRSFVTLPARWSAVDPPQGRVTSRVLLQPRIGQVFSLSGIADSTATSVADVLLGRETMKVDGLKRSATIHLLHDFSLQSQVATRWLVLDFLGLASQALSYRRLATIGSLKSETVDSDKSCMTAFSFSWRRSFASLPLTRLVWLDRNPCP